MQEDNIQNPEQEISENKELESCQKDLKSLKDAYVYLTADFENYKKRAAKDQARYAFMAESEFLLKLLPIIDDFDRAFKKGLENKNDNLESWLSGFEIINKELKKFLKEVGVEEVQMNTFDPNVHEAIAQISVESKEPGEIVDYVEKGYILRGHLLRPAKVAVSK